MKKIITALLLTLTFSTFVFADGVTPIMNFDGHTPIVGRYGNVPITGVDGNTPHTGRDGHIPITGYAGCEGGFWYPDSEVCCIPGQECRVARSATVFSNNNKIVAGLVGVFRSIYFF